MSTWTLLIVVMCVPEIVGHEGFRARIPNGYNVPDPCKPNVIWQGVGHKWFGGGGARNPFGKDFANNNLQWNADLCKLDSDGDGRTNGHELGDPDCVWTPGSTPLRTFNITHPGVCTPWGEGECNSKNYGWVCNELHCDYINAPDVRNITIRFPHTKVPAEVTNYYCFNFQLPTDQEYHMIATKPLINNSDVVHHMILTSCEGTVGLINEPQDCIMGTPSCSKAMGIWTVGMTGECINSQAGFRIGKGGTGTVSLQVHWNNPTKNNTWYDSSGLILYYTPVLRKYDAASFSVGQTNLNIPPGMPSVVHQGTCTSRCTKKIFKGPVHVVSSLNHMHNLGIRQNLTRTRSGMAQLIIMDDNPFSFDLPVSHEFTDPIIIEPGDELQTYCTYKSLSRDKTTLFGASTYDEMCFSYLTFFPAENITDSSCIQWQDTDLCDVTGNDCFDGSLFNTSHPNTSAMIEKILAHCNPYGGCRVECPAAIQDILREKPCLTKYWGFLATTFFSMNDAKLLKFVTAVESCGFANHTVMTPTTCSGVLSRVDMKFFAPLIALIFWTYL
ncbi:putative DBH-like monooxygenase protein 2 [Littorina saxatilis]|uniref:Temptin n=1 Tax=Littorina saxatilis TaxID=31220 RepID=A0AAN9ALC3_9CAEN